MKKNIISMAVAGVLGALAFPGLHGADILTAINNADGHSVFDQIRLKKFFSFLCFMLLKFDISVSIFTL